MDNFWNKFFFGSVLFFMFGFLIFPKTIFATKIYFSPDVKKIYENETLEVEAKISSPDNLINVADGIISFNPKVLSVKEIITSESVFSMWAQSPEFSNNKGVINFVGGIPDGFKNENGVILKIIFTALKKGDSKLFFDGKTDIFLSDGMGTKINYEKTPALIFVLSNSVEDTSSTGYEKLWIWGIILVILFIFAIWKILKIK